MNNIVEKMTSEYIDDLLVRAAHHSTAIEGNTLTLGDTISILIHNYIPKGMTEREYYEVKNYKKAFELLLKADRVISTDLIKNYHRYIMENLREDNGEFKKISEKILQSLGKDKALNHKKKDREFSLKKIKNFILNIPNNPKHFLIFLSVIFVVLLLIFVNTIRLMLKNRKKDKDDEIFDNNSSDETIDLLSKSLEKKKSEREVKKSNSLDKKRNHSLLKEHSLLREEKEDDDIDGISESLIREVSSDADNKSSKISKERRSHVVNSTNLEELEIRRQFNMLGLKRGNEDLEFNNLKNEKQKEGGIKGEETQTRRAGAARPGGGATRPGAKVYPWIAKTRHSTTGVGLISPPPHHDIYSIEDLAELIYDLKNANRNANINVKLVSEAGVGTIAAGVAKGGAQVILVSGYDGGTGAAPRTSIKHAGLPWELGIAETHQTLIMNGLRTRVRIESDSKLLSGRDVAISCMLGAEEFGFGTTLLMAEGCVMMRVCNLDTCPMGICTQNPELRKNFKGKPEYIINYLTFVAEELREYMAKLGVRTVDELVGRTDLLRVKPAAPGSRAAKLDLDCILHNPAIANSNVHFIKEDSYDFHLENTLDMKVLMKKFKLGSKAPQSVSLNVSNVDRAFGAIFGSEITRKYGNDLPDDVYTVHCNGAGGQSFGAFIPNGLTLELVGDCNDYMGKGLSGGKIVVRPPQGIDFKPEENIITGNVALYGATSGKAFISGVAGERFCVRNSGATAVVEGVGDHGCEYMTGGTVVVLGQTGKNFAAGMTGGIAYVLDENWDFYQRVNKETVSLEPVEHKYDVATLKELIRAHVEATGSPRGKEILDNFSAFLPKFKKVLPYDYDRMLRVIASVEERGLDGEQAQIEAFYAVQKHK